MTATLSQARDEIQAKFLAVWNAETPALNGGQAPEVRWQGLDNYSEAADPGKPWARVTIRHVPSGQTTLGEAPNRRFTRRGTLTIQVFTPVGNSGLALLENFATIVRYAFEGQTTPSGVWFRNVSVEEADPYQGWNQFNVTANFEYDEAR